MATIYIQTHGCSANFNDSEVMAGLLQKAEFQIVEDLKSAQIVIINVCTVKGDSPAIKKIKKIVKDYPDKKLVIAGCIPKDTLERIRDIAPDAGLVNTHNIKSIVEVVEEVNANNPLEAMTYNTEVKTNIAKVRKNPVISIIPILSGCNGECTYCSVRLIKGKLFSYPKEDIIIEARRSITQGCKELWITSQDNACYMLDKNEKSLLPELLDEIIAIPGSFKIRLGMMNPNNIKPIIGDLLRIYKSEKMFKFLHIPIQSGNDNVLEKMNRKYTLEDFETIVKTFREGIPDITIATDIICGFPSEKRIEFSQSVDLVKRIKPDIVNISRYRLRDGTTAAELKDQVPSNEAKARSRLLTSIFNNISYMNNEQYYDWTGEVVIEEIGKNSTFIGRTDNYKQVIVEGKLRLGDRVKVKIKKITRHYLVGVLVS